MIINTKSLTFLKIFLISILLFESLCVSHSNSGGNGAKCRKREQMALLQFKAELFDDYGRLSSWESSNCCEWEGVVCDNLTNHVVALHLRGPESVPELKNHFYSPYDLYPAAAPLRGKLSPSLLQLSHLQYLDLSLNDFNYTTIPNFIGSLSKLRHLSLSYSNFGGEIPHHIGNLSELQFLDLSRNWWLTDTNLDWLSGSPSLQYLDLSWTDLYGSKTWLQVLDKLTSLTEIHLAFCGLVAPVSLPSLNSSSNSLLVLDLSSNRILDSRVLLRFVNMTSSFTYIDFSDTNLEGGILDALGNLKSLSHLTLSYNNLNYTLDILGNLTSLSYLDLSYNQLQGEFPQPFKNSSSFTYLDLSRNKLNGQLSHLLTRLWDSTSLHYLSLSENAISGPFPNMSRYSDLKWVLLQNNLLNEAVLESNLRLPNLEYLDLSANNFTGRLPNLSSLAWLILTDNIFSGSLTKSICHLSKIEYLAVGNNQLEDVITEVHLSSLPRLKTLYLSFNLNISIRIDPSWIPPFQIHELMLAHCKLGPHFPKWLRNQNQLELVDISSSGIVDIIPSWFWGNIKMCTYLNMSHNQMHGILPDLSSTFTQLHTIDLSANQFTGSLPPLPPYLHNIVLPGNRFSGTILSFCDFIDDVLFVLDLSNNLLSGEIPRDCFKNFLSLSYVNLASNNFSGEIEIPTIHNLECRVSSLHLRNNSFRGELPRSLMNCGDLRILDLGENEINGTIPGWLGESIPLLEILILKSNMLYGILPSSLCHLSKIKVLDISLNKILGTIPNCMNNFTLLSSESDSNSWDYLNFPMTIGDGAFDHRFYDSASVVWKGIIATYIKTLGLLKVIDLSSNELSGEIPPNIITLIGLIGLNLSRNNLVGSIPHDIDQMKLLNFLDLSRNNLSGSIPLTLSKLSHLGVLNLSFNNLSGEIPWDTHMQTFENSSYLGNPGLCGLPLSKQCSEEKSNNGTTDSDKVITGGFYISMLLGFVVAFWVAFWTLFFNKWWNAFSIRICTSVADGMYVHILVSKRRFLRYVNNAA